MHIKSTPSVPLTRQKQVRFMKSILIKEQMKNTNEKENTNKSSVCVCVCMSVGDG